jgi:hypothetical protein
MDSCLANIYTCLADLWVDLYHCLADLCPDLWNSQSCLQILWGRQSCLQPPFRRLVWGRLAGVPSGSGGLSIRLPLAPPNPRPTCCRELS